MIKIIEMFTTLLTNQTSIENLHFDFLDDLIVSCSFDFVNAFLKKIFSMETFSNHHIWWFRGCLTLKMPRVLNKQAIVNVSYRHESTLDMINVPSKWWWSILIEKWFPYIETLIMIETTKYNKWQINSTTQKYLEYNL